jgi:hypothetical protein
MSAKSAKYSSKLKSLLNKHNDVCNEIVILAIQHDIHDKHVQASMDVIRSRVTELKKQLEQMSSTVEFELPDVEDESAIDSKKSVAKKPVDSDTSVSDNNMSSSQGFPS